jgi:hypothetical protein
MRNGALIRRISSAVVWAILIGGGFLAVALLGGIFGLVLLHLMAWGALLLVLWDGRLPVSEKAMFVCGDCRFHWTLDQGQTMCTLTEQKVSAPNPACRDLRLRRPAA